MKKLLFLDDDEIFFWKIHEEIKDLFDICYVQTVEKAIMQLQKEIYDVVVLDRQILMRNGDVEDGLDVAKEIVSKPDRYLEPIIFVVSGIKKTPEDKLEAYNVEAKNCFFKPEENKIFLTVLKKQSPDFNWRKFLCYYTLKIDTDAQKAKNNNREVYLNSSEYYVLLELVKHQGCRIRKERLEKLSFGNKTKVSDNSLSTTIHRLRQKLPIINENLESQRYAGYLLKRDERKKM